MSWRRRAPTPRRFGTARSGLPVNYAHRLAASDLLGPCRLEPVLTSVNVCPGGGIGRHGNLVRCWPRGRAGSTPAPGTPAAASLTAVGGYHTLIHTYQVAAVVPPPTRLGPFGPGLCVVCPAWMVTWGWKSPGELVVATQANRQAATVRGRLKAAGSEAASRGTRTGYEARPSRASGQQTAKLSRPRLRRCKSGGCAGKATVLTWGDLALRLKGRRGRPGARSQPRP